MPFDDLFNKVKQNTQNAGRQMSIAAKIAKLKLEISTQYTEKDRHLKTIGVKTYAIFCKDRVLDGNVIHTEISNELNLIERIDKHVDEIRDQITELRAEFGHVEGQDIVEADDVTESDDHTPGK